MKIAIISDLHFGFGQGTEREEDAWEGTEKAFEKAKDSDLILLAGDIFDTKIPMPEDWSRAIHLLSKFKTLPHKKIEVSELIGKEHIPDTLLSGIPIIAIHGTHERRGNKTRNSIEALEYAGFLIHLHCNTIVLNAGEEKVAVHGMSGVPESYALDVLREWNPKPVKGAYNIFMLHQSIQPYIYSKTDPPSLKLEDLPEGFDLYVSGHIHWRVETDVHGKPFIIPGSVVTTQTRKIESETPKGFFVVDTEKNKKNSKKGINFVEIQTRKAFYKTIEVKEKQLSQIREEIEDFLEEIKDEGKPLVRVKLVGKLRKGMDISDINFGKLKKKYSSKMILSIGKKLTSEKLKAEIGIFKELQSRRLSIEEIGMEMLRKKIKNMSFDYEHVLNLLAEGNVEKSMNFLLNSKPQKNENKKTAKNKKSGPDKETLFRWSYDN